MKKRIISLFCILTLVFTSFAWMLPVAAAEDENAVLIGDSEIPLILKYDEQAPFEGENSPAATMHDDKQDKGWNNWSLPIGNGYFGVSTFGRTETERLQITEKTLSNPWRAPNPNGSGNISNLGGLNNFSETYIDFRHEQSGVSNYQRYLDLKTAISGVKYTYGGVNYEREYFASYDDKAFVIYLSADTEGALSFTLRPTVPYEQSYAVVEGDKGSKTGTVTSSVKNGVGTVELTGKLGYYDVDFMGLYKVYTDGGTVKAATTTHTYKDTAGVTHNDTDGTIVVEGAKSAYIVVTLGTDYELSESVFTSSDSNKPTFSTNLTHTRAKVEGYMSAIEARLSGMSFAEAYSALRSTHVADHSELFGRVTLDLGCDSADFEKTTAELLENYQEGKHSTYLETLMFQYGRYMLIASSRSGALPAHLQGAWNTYNIAPWASGYWHNINVQMNYWPAFSTNLAETFEAYVQLNDAYMKKAKAYADSVIGKINPPEKDVNGENGWTIGVGNTAYDISSDNSPGNAGYTTQLFWDYYRYTGDRTLLEEYVFPVLLDAAKFITKCVKLTEEGKYLVAISDSPEMFVNGVWYYTEGTTYAQTFAYLNNYNTLLAAKELGILSESGELIGNADEYAILNTVLEQIGLYDPINVGLSGQIKEFREEDYYGSVGDEPNHRHISQLVGLSPGNLINANTPAWLDAALVTLEGRASADAHGWVFAHKINLYARAFDSANAYSMLNGFISHCTPNLWSLYNNRIFQVEANFGTTAGIAEMLMQSHNGYIELLPSVTEAWADGSFTGLVAAGGFEVSAAWEESLLKTVNVLSKNGGSVSVKYPSIGNARVTDSRGRAVSCEITGKNVITFNTTKGETYIISGFQEVKTPDSPAELAYTRAAFGPFRLACSAVEGAVGYNLYTAVENSPVYTLVASSEKNYFTYIPTEDNKNARTTFAVTAVDANGEESKRTLCYYNPAYTDADINEIYASFLSTGALQVIVDSNDNASKYKLWEKRSDVGEFVLVDESAYPILMTKSYNRDYTYAVSVVSGYDGKESEKKLISADYDPNNVLLGKDFVPTPETQNYVFELNGSYLGLDRLTDGIYTSEVTGRYSSTYAGKADATLSLGATYILSELKINLYKGDISSAGIEDKFVIQISSGGKWITVFDGASQNLADYKDGSTPYLVFDLGCREVEKIRFKAEAAEGKTVTFQEIMCSGVLAESYKNETENVLSGLTFVPSEATKENIYNTYFGFGNLTDGDKTSESTGRFSTQYGKDAEATVSLSKAHALSELRVYLYKGETIRAGKYFKLDIMLDGEWLTVFEGDQNAIKNHLVDKYLSFDLGYAVAEKIRFSASALDASNAVSFYEIECSGFELEVPEIPGMKDNILADKQFTPTEATKGNVYNQSYGFDKITDSESAQTPGRFSSGYGKAVSATANLGSSYALSKLVIEVYDGKARNAGETFKLEIANGGVWTTVFDGSYTELERYMIGRNLVFDLEFAIADRIRFTGTSISGYTVTFHEIKCSGFLVEEKSFDSQVSNIFNNGNNKLQFVPSADTSAEDFAYLYGSKRLDVKLLTDGSMASTANRYSSAKGKNLDATVNFGAIYALDEIRFYLYNNSIPESAGESFKVEAYYNGVWETLFEGNPAALTKTGNNLLVFTPGGMLAEKLRVYAKPSSSGYVTFYEIECTARKLKDNTAVISGGNIFEGAGVRVPSDSDFSDNILLKKTVTPESGSNAHIYGNNEDYGYSKLTDGEGGGRYSSKRANQINDANAIVFDASIDLGGVYALGSFKINYYTDSNYPDDFFGTEIQLQVYYNGSWKTVKHFTSVSDILAGDDDKNNGNWLDFDISGELAEKIRLTVPHIDESSGAGRTISFHEIECSGAKLNSGSGAVSDENTPENTTDGSLDSYLEVLGTDSYSVEIELERPRKLTTLAIWELIDEKNLVGGRSATASDETTVEIYKNGNWIKVYKNISLDGEVTLFDMFGVESDKIRITFKNTRLFDGEAAPRAARIREIVFIAEPETLNLTEMKEALDKLPSVDVEDDVNGKYLQNEAYKKFKSYVLNLDATEEDIAAYVAEIEEYYEALSSAVLSAYNISLGGDIAVNFKYKLINADTLVLYPNAYAEIKIPTKTGEKTTKIYFKDAATDSEERYIFSASLAAAQMTDTVSVRIVYDDDTASEAFGTSVREYADYILAHPEMEKGYPGISELVRSMLNYGAYAQSYFGYNTDNLASEGVYSVGTDPVLNKAVSDSSAVSVVGSAAGLTFSGWKIALLSETTASFYFTLEGSAGDYTFTVTSPNGSVKSVSAVRDGERYRISIRNIGAGNLDKYYKITAVNVSDSSKTEITFSATCYVASALGSSDANLVKLVKALKLYSEAANTYFGKVNAISE